MNLYVEVSTNWYTLYWPVAELIRQMDLGEFVIVP